MAVTTWTIASLDGQSLTGGNLACKFLRRDQNNPLTMGKMRAVEATVPGFGVRDVRSQREATTWRLYVRLTATDETDVQSMLAIFSEERGLVYLRATDGSATTWRVPCRVVGVEREAESSDLWIVVLRVPYPVWETDSASTTSSLNVTDASAGVALAPTNAGSRKTYPALTWTADAAKDQDAALNDWTWTLRTFAVSRMPFAGKVPVFLFDSSAAASRFGTDTSASGATVIQTTGASDASADIGAADVTISLVSAAAFSANGGIAYIDASNGDEAIIYTGKSGNNLTGCTRGAGGTTAAAHTVAQVTNIHPSATFPDGRDVAVWVNDIKLPDDQVWPVSWNAAASDVCINLDLPAARYVSLAATLGSATTGIVKFNEAVAHMPDSGFIAFENEVCHYSGKSGVNGLVIDVRGVWGTTAASHAAAVKGYANPVRIVVALGYANAGARPTSVRYRPAIQLPGSSNQTYKWGDESNDANTIFFNRDTPDRTMQFVPGFDTDGNTVSPLLSISAFTTALTFKDDVPGDGNPPYNFAEVSIPQGIDAGSATAVIADWTPAAEILNLEMFARDAQGVPKLIDQLQQTAAAANRSPAAFTNNMYGLKLKGRHNAVTGYYETSTTNSSTISNTSLSSTAADGNVAVQFILDQETLITSVLARLACTGAGSQDLSGTIHANTQVASIDVPQEGDAGLIAQSETVAVASTSAAMIRFSFAVPILLPAGTYWFMINRATAAVVTVNWYRITNHAKSPRDYRGSARAAGAWGSTLGTFDFKLNTFYDPGLEAPIQNEMPMRLASTGARTAVTASFDGVELVLEPTQSVYVHRNTAFVTGATAGALFHLQGTVTNSTTGDTLTPDVWLKLTATLEVDAGSDLITGTKRVTKSEDGISYPLTGAVQFSNVAEWLPLVVGANSLAWDDDSLVAGGQADISLVHRSRKV